MLEDIYKDTETQMQKTIDSLIRDYAEKDIMVDNMRRMANDIMKDKQPLIIQIAKNMSRTEHDYKKVAKDIKNQADALEKSLGLLKGQIEHRYEDYLSTLVRHKRFVEAIIGDEKNKAITGHRAGKQHDKITVKEEEVLFEKDFDKITDEDRETLKEIDKKIKSQAEEKNV